MDLEAITRDTVVSTKQMTRERSVTLGLVKIVQQTEIQEGIIPTRLEEEIIRITHKVTIFHVSIPNKRKVQVLALNNM